MAPSRHPLPRPKSPLGAIIAAGTCCSTAPWADGMSGNLSFSNWGESNELEQLAFPDWQRRKGLTRAKIKPSREAFAHAQLLKQTMTTREEWIDHVFLAKPLGFQTDNRLRTSYFSSFLPWLPQVQQATRAASLLGLDTLSAPVLLRC